MIRFFFIFCTFSFTTCLAHLDLPASLTYEKAAESNTHYDDFIPIKNSGDEPLNVKITHVDYLYNSQGETHFAELGTNARSNAAWMKLSHHFMTIPPHETTRLHFNVTIPDNRQLQGTYWSMFLIEPVVPPADIPEAKNSVGLQTVVRYGVQVITNVGEKGICSLKILNKNITRNESGQLFLLDVENSGSSLLEPGVSIDIFDQSGKLAGHFVGRKCRILPSCSIRYDIDITIIPAGKYKAVVILDGEEKGVFGAQYDLNIS